MAEQKKIQLYTDRACTVEASPETMAKNVTLSDGLDVESVLKHDLTAPTVVHEETSFKIGVGDIDVSSSVVDGEPSKVVIKGKTYQNILPEPSLRNSMTNGKSMQKLNEGYENVNVVDGVAKSAILKGNTLVNVVGEKYRDCNLPTNQYVTAYGMDNTYNSDSYRIKQIDLKCPLIPNKEYLIIVDVQSMENCTTLMAYTYDGTTTDYNASLRPKKIGLHMARYTPTTAITRIAYYVANNTEEKVIFGQPMIIEYQQGMENWDISYFEGIQSVKMPVLQTTGKNLFDLELVQGARGYGVAGLKPDFFASDSRVTNANGNYIKVNPNTKITFSISNNIDFAIAELDINGYTLGDTGWVGYTTIKPNHTITTKEKTSYIGFNFRKLDNSNITVQEVLDSNPMLEINNTATTYEPYKSNILSTPEDLVLGKVGDVEDTLNVLTGELSLKTHEITLDVTDIAVVTGSVTDRFEVTSTTKPLNNQFITIENSGINSWGLQVINNFNWERQNSICYHANVGKFYFRFKTGLYTVETLQQKLNENPLTLRYTLSTETNKTVDLSSYGNWDKVVLNGSENWSIHSSNVGYVEFKYSNGINNVDSSRNGFSDKFKVSSGGLYERVAVTNQTTYITIESTKANTVEQLQLWLSQNPITVWYQTTSQQENSITEVLSFSKGHIQLSSEEGSLIPSLDYEVPTSNSYHMDLMKTDTRYTMKCTHSGGTFTIDGTQYSMGSNVRFNSPSSLTNKLLVVNSNMTNSMILEGDVTSKSLPYFKGIRSAFEGESKIEVLSTGKNLFDGEYIYGTLNGGTGVVNHNPNGTRTVSVTPIKMKVGKTYVYTMQNNNSELDCFFREIVLFSDKECNNRIAQYGNTVTTLKYSPSVDCYVRFSTIAKKDGVEERIDMNKVEIQIEETSSSFSYEPYKSNVSKIPLLSPLRSLPNGVCDELIIDRMKKKATLI